MPEYRPCIVTETVKKKIPSKSTDHLIDIKREVVNHKALFHCWSERFWVYQPLMIGESAGQMSQIVGIVEYEDGTVHEYLPKEIQFTDGIAEKFSNDKKDDWHKIDEDSVDDPELFKRVLFKTRIGLIYYGYCDDDFNWTIQLDHGNVYFIQDVVAWKEL